MYSLYPSADLRRIRARFGRYEICELHDSRGAPCVNAVLKPDFRRSGLAELITASSVAQLAVKLRAQEDRGPADVA